MVRHRPILNRTDTDSRREARQVSAVAQKKKRTTNASSTIRRIHQGIPKIVPDPEPLPDPEPADTPLPP